MIDPPSAPPSPSSTGWPTASRTEARQSAGARARVGEHWVQVDKVFCGRPGKSLSRVLETFLSQRIRSLASQLVHSLGLSFLQALGWMEGESSFLSQTSPACPQVPRKPGPCCSFCLYCTSKGRAPRLLRAGVLQGMLMAGGQRGRPASSPNGQTQEAGVGAGSSSALLGQTVAITENPVGFSPGRHVGENLH